MEKIILTREDIDNIDPAIRQDEADAKRWRELGDAAGTQPPIVIWPDNTRAE